MVKRFLFSSFLFVSILMIGQNDTINKMDAFDRGKGFNIDAKLLNNNLQIDENQSENDFINLLLEKKESPRLSYKFDVKEYLKPKEKKRNFMYGPKPLENDVVVIKHYDGKDTTTKIFKTTQNLGTIQSNTEYVRIEYRDFGLVDGDRVRVFLNEKEIDANVHLNGLFYTLHIKLAKKGYNRIDIQAINEGYVGPNTAEFIAYDDQGNIIAHKAWNLEKDQIATLGIVKY